MFLKILLLTIILLAIAFVGLGIQTFFSKKKKFPQTKIGHNKEMSKRGIYCFKTQQKRIDKGLDSNCKTC